MQAVVELSGGAGFCHADGERHCGACGTCVERLEAFAMAGAPDPTDYQR
jgi:7-cyano-7-deazaguanine synthase